ESSLWYVPGCPRALLEKGRMLHKQGKAQEARHCFEQVASYTLPTPQKNKSTGPQNGRVFLLNLCSKGYALLELQKFAEARQTFQEISQQIGMPTDADQKTICAEAY